MLSLNIDAYVSPLVPARPPGPPAGAPEIGRLQRSLMSSDRVLGAAGGVGNLRVLPLHGSLSSADQSKVFNR